MKHFLAVLFLAVAAGAIEEPITTDTTHPRAVLPALSGIQGFGKDLRVYVREDGKPYALPTNAVVTMYYATNMAAQNVGTAHSVSIDTNGSALVLTEKLPAGSFSYALALAAGGRTNDLGTGLLTVRASSFGGGFWPLPGQTIDWSTLVWSGSNQPLRSGAATVNGSPLTNGAALTIGGIGSTTDATARAWAQAGSNLAASAYALALTNTGGISGPYVQSVNGATGAVSVTAASINADVAGAAQAASQGVYAALSPAVVAAQATGVAAYALANGITLTGLGAGSAAWSSSSDFARAQAAAYLTGGYLTNALITTNYVANTNVVCVRNAGSGVNINDDYSWSIWLNAWTTGNGNKLVYPSSLYDGADVYMYSNSGQITTGQWDSVIDGTEPPPFVSYAQTIAGITTQLLPYVVRDYLGNVVLDGSALSATAAQASNALALATTAAGGGIVASNALYATTAGAADYATSAGTAAEALQAGNAQTAGVATWASYAGRATNGPTGIAFGSLAYKGSNDAITVAAATVSNGLTVVGAFTNRATSTWRDAGGTVRASIDAATGELTVRSQDSDRRYPSCAAGAIFCTGGYLVLASNAVGTATFTHLPPYATNVFQVSIFVQFLTNSFGSGGWNNFAVTNLVLEGYFQNPGYNNYSIISQVNVVQVPLMTNDIVYISGAAVTIKAVRSVTLTVPAGGGIQGVLQTYFRNLGYAGPMSNMCGNITMYLCQ